MRGNLGPTSKSLDNAQNNYQNCIQCLEVFRRPPPSPTGFLLFPGQSEFLSYHNICQQKLTSVGTKQEAC